MSMKLDRPSGSKPVYPTMSSERLDGLGRNGIDGDFSAICMEADDAATVVEMRAPHSDERWSAGREARESDGTKAAIFVGVVVVEWGRR